MKRQFRPRIARQAVPGAVVIATRGGKAAREQGCMICKYDIGKSQEGNNLLRFV